MLDPTLDSTSYAQLDATVLTDIFDRRLDRSCSTGAVAEVSLVWEAATSVNRRPPIWPWEGKLWRAANESLLKCDDAQRVLDSWAS